jgi:L-alanine-DL-glutamate epimerase-like enolase superfamily enzyme
VKIRAIEAFALSCPIPETEQVSLGIGRTVKRDAVLVKITTDGGLVGWGEAHAGRAPTVIAELVHSTLAPAMLGQPADDIAGIWARLYRLQLASHGTGAAAALAISGIDMALWDLRGKAVGLPLYALLGGEHKVIPAYAGGISLGYGSLEALLEEAQAAVAAGYRALKLRLGQDPATDIARVEAVRKTLGSAVDILTDANCSYTVEAAREVRAALDELEAGWLEEPFSAHDFKAYAALGGAGRTPLAAGENHFLLSDFERLADDGVVRLWQPDVSKCGGLSEALRIAQLADRLGIWVHPHTSVSGLNMAASLHFLAALPNAGYYEADYSRWNPLRTEVCSPVLAPDANGAFSPPTGPGLGVEVDEDALRHYPPLRGAGYR